MNRLLTAREAAEMLAISERKLWSITHPRGDIPVVRLGKSSVRYCADAIGRWVAEQADAITEREVRS